ncbi:S24 family peptidase [Brevundimonas sp.]|uniref:S24 family peptidase n=1 Tax=Brevundimonas sp. TaxID=1871086 RepID=UPI0028A69F9C|nr:S24 family peptidase [Brevundimonas sp.]
MLNGMDSDAIIAALRRLGVTHDKIAEVIGRDRTAATKMLGGTRRVQAAEIRPLTDLIHSLERDAGEVGDQPTSLVRSYVEIEVLPTYAGMGGGGTGDGDRSLALLPRSLVEDELRAKPGDLLVIHVRGDSMEPRFLDGDQIVIDRRERNPLQPGPFALWFDDGYVLKQVERIRATGKLRITSSNPAYSPDEADPEEVNIMGRPVWFMRRL